MTTTVTGGITIKSNWNAQKTNGITSLSTGTSEAVVYKYEETFASGNGANEIEQIFRDTRVVTLATGTDDIDLSGALLDMFGDALAFLTIRELVIVNLSTVAGEDLLIGAAGSNPVISLFNGDASAQVPCRAGGAQVWCDPLVGFAVAAGSADVLRVQHDGAAGDINFDIIVKGTITA